MEYRRFPPGQSQVSTFEFHEHRERAPHLEQGAHRERLLTAAKFVKRWDGDDPRMDVKVIDLGCGDGGLVSEIMQMGIDVRGYDFQPTNVEGWIARGVDQLCSAVNFVNDWGYISNADLYILTEVLEHLEEPHEMVQRVADRGAALIASSPYHEHAGSIDACHNWAWDVPGYIAMLEANGMCVIGTELVSGWSQVHLAVPA